MVATIIMIFFTAFIFGYFEVNCLIENEIEFQFLMKYYKSIINFVKRPKKCYQIELHPDKNLLIHEPHIFHQKYDLTRSS